MFFFCFFLRVRALPLSSPWHAWISSAFGLSLVLSSLAQMYLQNEIAIMKTAVHDNIVAFVAAFIIGIKFLCR